MTKKKDKPEPFHIVSLDAPVNVKGRVEIWTHHGCRCSPARCARKRGSRGTPVLWTRAGNLSGRTCWTAGAEGSLQSLRAAVLGEAPSWLHQRPPLQVPGHLHPNEGPAQVPQLQLTRPAGKSRCRDPSWDRYKSEHATCWAVQVARFEKDQSANGLHS